MQKIGVRSWRLRIVAGAVLVGLPLILTQCKKDPTAPRKVAAANLSIPATRANVTALDGKSFSFANGGALAPELAGTSLTMTFSNTAAANPTTTFATGAGGSATATTTFGSCIFTITVSSFPTTHSLGVGKTITINTCTITVNTAGLQTGTTGTVNSTITLGGTVSAPTTLTVTVAADGTVSVGGTTLGKVPTQTATGSGD